MNLFFLVIDLPKSSLFAHQAYFPMWITTRSRLSNVECIRFSLLSHSLFFSHNRDTYLCEDALVLIEDTVIPSLIWLQLNQQKCGPSIFVKRSRSILILCRWCLLEGKPLYSLLFWWLRYPKAFGTRMLSHMQLHISWTSETMPIISSWNQCFLPTHIVHSDFQVDLDEPELSSEHYDVICWLEAKPSLIGISCLLSKLVYCIQLSPVTVTPNCVSDHYVIVW